MSEYSNSATRQLLNQGNRFGRWMRSCVDRLVEDLAGSVGDSASSRTMVVMGGDGAEIYSRGKAGQREYTARADGSAEEIAVQLKRQIRGSKAQNVLLRVTNDKAVMKEIQLPAGALEVLPAVVRNKIESLAAWPMSEALWGYRVSSPLKSGQFGVTVGVVSRKALNGMLAVLRDAGLKIDYLDIGASPDDPDAIAIDFQSDGRLARARRMVAATMSVLTLLALGTASYGLYLAATAYSELTATQQRSEDLRKALLNRTGAGEAGAKLTEANKLYTRKQEIRPVVVILNDLTKLVPDGTWLNSIDYTGSQVTISGRGTEIPKVIEGLEKSEVFSKVNFASATQRDASLNVDVFSVSATIETKGIVQ